MITERIYLKEQFPALGKDECNAYVDYYIPSAYGKEREDLRDKKHPCMVVCPGGGYNYTSDRESEPVAMHFAAEGYRVAVVRYSCAPHCFPQQLLEVAGAMELIYEHAEEWRIDTSRIAIIGFSAGGHLAAQYSNRYNCEEIRAIFPESKGVQACVLSYPVITDTTPTHGGTVRNFVGHEPIERNEKGCSCECIVSDQTPPTFLWHTSEDAAVPVRNSLLYAQALSEHKIPFEMHIYPYGSHGLSLANPVVGNYTDEKVLRVCKWLEEAKSWLKMMGV